MVDIAGQTTAITNLLMIGTLALALVLVPFGVFGKLEKEPIHKITGVLFVVGLALGARDPWIFAIAIFIVATMITSQDFLEKLAALVMRNGKYFDYLIAKASASEVEEKTKRELDRDGNDSTLTPDQTNPVQFALGFEAAALEILRQQGGLFPSHHVRTGIRLGRGSRKSIVDAIASGPLADYIVEVKASRSSAALYRATEQIRRYIDAYQSTISLQGQSNPVKGIIVVPNVARHPNFIGNDLAVLKFDIDKLEFTNLSEIREWMMHGRAL